MMRLIVSLSVCVILVNVSNANCRLFPRLARPYCPPPVIVVPPMASAEVGSPLRLRFEKGRDFYVEVVTETLQKMTVKVSEGEPQEVKQTQNQTFVYLIQPEEMTPSEDWRVSVCVAGIRFKVDLGGNVIEYDSTKKQAVTPMTEFFDALLKARFKTTIAPDGTISKLGGVKELMELLTPVSSRSSFVAQVLNEASIKKMISPLGDFLPAKAMQAGERWTRRDMLDLGPIGRYDTDYQYTLRELSENMADIRFVSSMKYLAPEPGKKSGLPFVIRSADIRQSRGEGAIIFDVARGRLRESTQQQVLTGTLVIEVGNMDTAVDLEQAQKSRVRVLDDNPVSGSATPQAAFSSGR